MWRKIDLWPLLITTREVRLLARPMRYGPTGPVAPPRPAGNPAPFPPCLPPHIPTGESFHEARYPIEPRPGRRLDGQRLLPPGFAMLGSAWGPLCRSQHGGTGTHPVLPHQPAADVFTLPPHGVSADHDL